jgi:hypothetical protein
MRFTVSAGVGTARKLVAAVVTGVLTLLLAATAHTAPLTCTVSVPSVTIVHVLGPADVGDIAVSCTGDPAVATTFALDAFFNASVAPSSTPLLTMDAIDYAGVIEATIGNKVTFTDLPLMSDLSFLISGIAIETAQLGFSTTGVPTQVVTFLSARPGGTLPLANPQQTVALLVPQATVPEPAVLILSCVGLLGAAAAQRFGRL